MNNRSGTNTWGRNWGQNQKKFGTGGAAGAASGTKYSYGAKNTAINDYRNGQYLNEPPADTISDICVNDHLVVATASWSGIRIWKNVPKVQTTQTTTTSAYQHKQIPYDFEIFDDVLKDRKCLEMHNEPVIRCTFDTLQNSIVYFGNAYGKIIKVYLESIKKEEYAGHHVSMITGLKYCRDKRAYASSSTDGTCFLWDPRKNPIGCAHIPTNINSTNLDFVQNTIAICGIGLDTSLPTVKLYDIRNLTNPLPPPPTTTTSFLNQKKAQQAEVKPSIFEMLKYPKKNEEINPDLLQFSSIILDRTGTNFIAGTLGGFIVNSKSQTENTAIDKYNYEYTFLVKNHPRVTTQQQTSTYKTPQQKQSSENTENMKYKAINCLAMIPAPVRNNKITANPIFVGTSSGQVSSITGFRISPISQDGVNIINPNYIPQQANPITAIGVSPNGKLFAFASGDDFNEGCVNRFNTPKEAKVGVKLIDTDADFVKTNRI